MPTIPALAGAVVGYQFAPEVQTKLDIDADEQPIRIGSAIGGALLAYAIADSFGLY
jgi:hypothetical protein